MSSPFSLGVFDYTDLLIFQISLYVGFSGLAVAGFQALSEGGNHSGSKVSFVTQS